MPRIILTLFVMMFSSLARSENFQDFFQDAPTEDDYVHTFTNGAYLNPNEEDFYVFEHSLRNKTDVMISVGTFRALENASRGNFSHVLMMDMDMGIVQFNRYQIEVLKKSPTRKDFILNFIGNRMVFRFYPVLKDYFERGEFNKMTAILKANDLDHIFPGIVATSQMIKFKYLEAIFRLCDKSRGYKAGFLASDERYQRLHQLAVQGRMAAVQGDLTDPGFGRIGHTLRENDLQVSILDVSNAPDFFLYSLDGKADSYRLNLAQIPFTEEARIQFTSNIMPGIKRMGMWNYLSFPAAEYMHNLGAILSRGAYSYFLFWPSTRARVVGPPQPGMRCIELF